MAKTDKTIFDWIIRRLDNVTGPNSEGWYHARCPACGGNQPLGIRPYRTTSFLHKCFKSDCSQADILAALNGEAPKRDAIPADKTTSSSRDLGELALEIGAEAYPALGSLVEKYLLSRGIVLDSKQPAVLGFHLGLRHKSGVTLPAMIALVQAPDGHPIGIHRTWLRVTGATVGKADVEPNKMALGPIAGGAVRLARAVNKIGLAEGIETALSFTQLKKIPCWAGLGGNLNSVVLPPQFGEVVLAVDGDEAGDRYLAELTRRYEREGRSVQAMQAPRGMDWNDVLLERFPRPQPDSSPRPKSRSENNPKGFPRPKWKPPDPTKKFTRPNAKSSQRPRIDRR